MNIIQVKQNGPTHIHHTNGYLEMEVQVDMNTLAPKVGDRFRCCIIGIYDEGIFTKYDKMSILTPKTQLTDDWVLGDQLVKNGDDEYKIGDWLTVEITAVQYAHHNWQCIGSIQINKILS
jgi:DNA-directed RNA polymerase subunit E'/Rpb7